MSSHHVLALRSIGLVLAGVFVVLAGWVVYRGSLPGDRPTLIELNDAIGTTLDEPMMAVGVATDSLAIGVAVAVIVAVLVYFGRRSDALVFLAVVGPVLVLNPVLKYIIGRDRPDVRFSPEVVSSHSFPSGHAAGTAAFVGALMLVASTRRSRIFAALVGSVALIVVAFSRLVIGVHYPSDIIGGWLWVGSLVCLVWSVSAAHGATPHGGSHRG
jgi:undecaprenyl-diphosphatase